MYGEREGVKVRERGRGGGERAHLIAFAWSWCHFIHVQVEHDIVQLMPFSALL